MKRRDFLRTAGIAGTLAATHSFSQPSSTNKPNIVFLLSDQWRASAMGYNGDPNVKTPHLDRLAGNAVNFTNTVSVCPVCTPYRACLLTGRYPLSTGMFMNDLYLPDESLCMAEIFSKAGYQTAYIGKWHVDGHGRDSFIPPQRRQGFDYWKGAECDHNYPHSHYYSGESPEKLFWEGYDAFAQTRDAQAYLRNHSTSQSPFLLFVSYGTPHFPHDTAPEEFRALYPPEKIQLAPNVPDSLREKARQEACGYYAHCTALDTCIGDILRTLDETGLADNTILVFTSDHGEMLGSQGQPVCEKQRPWDESVHVPFLLRYPKLHGCQGQVITTPLNTPDILPTLLGLCSLPLPSTLEGRDLSGLIRGELPEHDRAALILSVAPFAGYFGGREYRGIRTRQYTYVRSLEGPWLLYDNLTDPFQINNLINQPKHAQLQADLENQLLAELEQTHDSFQPAQFYLDKWGYQVDETGCIAYTGNFRIQGPGLRGSSPE